MRHRGLYTAYGIGVALVTIAVMVGLLLLNAAEETQAFAMVALVCLAGMGISALAVRYPP